MRAHPTTEEGLKWPKRLGGMCACVHLVSIDIAIIYLAEDTEKYIVDDEAVRSNKIVD